MERLSFHCYTETPIVQKLNSNDLLPLSNLKLKTNRSHKEI